jgi:hypothetical protein
MFSKSVSSLPGVDKSLTQTHGLLSHPVKKKIQHMKINIVPLYRYFIRRVKSAHFLYRYALHDQNIRIRNLDRNL